MTVTSSAAGLPRVQQSRYTSAGWELAPGISAGTFLLGARTADRVAENKAILKESCWWILSPLPPQLTWWSPNLPVETWQTGQTDPSSSVLTHSQYCRQRQNSIWSWRCSPREVEGTTRNQFPAWEIGEERARALSWILGTVFARRSKGVQQGDPLGPLLFCLSIHQLTTQLYNLTL